MTRALLAASDAQHLRGARYTRDPQDPFERCRGGWLTCLDVATGEYWQANEQGEARSDWLE